MVECVIDGHCCNVPEGTVLDAVLSQGLYIPHACHIPGSRNLQAACDLCFVEVSGVGHPVRACEQPVSDGMEICLSSSRARELSRCALALIAANHVLDCPTCQRGEGGLCELREAARYLGVPLRWRGGKQQRARGALCVKGVSVDPEKCLLCARCVEACASVGQGLLGIRGRGARSFVGVYDPDGRACEICAACQSCLASCPAGALLWRDKALDSELSSVGFQSGSL